MNGSHHAADCVQPIRPADRLARHRQPPRWLRVLAWLGILALLVMLLASVAMYLRYNLHVVRPGQLYRCGQLPDQAWPEVLRRYGVRSMINLRGPHPERHWYQAEKQAAQQCGAVHVDLSLSRQNLPDPAKLQQLLLWHDTLPRPVLIHCEAGADRTSMAVILWLLLEDDATLTEVRQQLGWGFLQLPWRNGSRQTRRLLREYEIWLRQNDLSHRPQHFRRWLTEHYSALYELGQVERLPPPAILPVQDCIMIRFGDRRGQLAPRFSPCGIESAVPGRIDGQVMAAILPSRTAGHLSVH